VPSLGDAFQKDFKAHPGVVTGRGDIRDHRAAPGLHEVFEVDCKLLITEETFALHNKLMA